MSFEKKIWKDRISEYPTRRNLEKSDGSSELVTVSRSEGNISQEGDAFSAENMNDLEERVSNEFEALNTKINTYFPVPDYENAVTIATDTYAAPADGWVSAFATRTANGASTSAPMKAIIYVNNVRVSEAYSTSGFPSSRLSPVPVRAGDNIKFDVVGQSGGALRYFYPIRV